MSDQAIARITLCIILSVLFISIAMVRIFYWKYKRR